MSLDWDMTRVPNREIVEQHVKEAMIWYSMVCAWGWNLTSENVAKAWDRISYYEKAVGPIMVGADGPVGLTRDEVYSMVGLSTNVAPITDAQFLKNIYRTHVEKNARIARAA